MVTRFSAICVFGKKIERNSREPTEKHRSSVLYEIEREIEREIDRNRQKSIEIQTNQTNQMRESQETHMNRSKSNEKSNGNRINFKQESLSGRN